MGIEPLPGLYARYQAAEKFWDGKRWPNLVPSELACKCGGKYCEGSYYHDPRFLDRLQAMRNGVGKPLIINSGHRCERWNTVQKGSKSSRHKTIAADISTDGHDRQELLVEALAAGFTGIGFGLRFLHVDTRKTPARWDYGAASRKAWGLEAAAK